MDVQVDQHWIWTAVIAAVTAVGAWFGRGFGLGARAGALAQEVHQLRQETAADRASFAALSGKVDAMSRDLNQLIGEFRQHNRSKEGG